MSAFSWDEHGSWLPPESTPHYVVSQHPLRRVLAFRRKTIHDVINDPVARREVAEWFKLHKWVQRGMEILELERQWNGM